MNKDELSKYYLIIVPYVTKIELHYFIVASLTICFVFLQIISIVRSYIFSFKDDQLVKINKLIY